MCCLCSLPDARCPRRDRGAPYGESLLEPTKQTEQPGRLRGPRCALGQRPEIRRKKATAAGTVAA